MSLRGGIQHWMGPVRILGLPHRTKLAQGVDMLRRLATDRLALVIALALAPAACVPQPAEKADDPRSEADSAQSGSVTANADTAAPHAGPPRTEPVDGQWRQFEGTVAEVVAAGSYAYVRVDRGDQAVWVVTMGSAPALDARVAVKGMGERHDFHSRRLDRTFDHLIFGTFKPA